MSFFVGGGGGGSHSSSHHRGHHSSSHSHKTSTRPGYARSSSSIFSSGRGGSSSYYKRRPRDGYIAYLVDKLKRLVTDLWDYARKHPVKAFFAVVVPLISAGGAVHSLLRQFGIRLPAAFDGTSRTVRGGYYGSSGYAYDSGFGGGSGGGGSGGMMGNVGSLIKIAQAFM